MKTAFIAIVVLSLVADSPANGQDPASGGSQCVVNCLSAATQDDRCARYTGRLTCIEDCQVDKYADLTSEYSRILVKYCGDGIDPAIAEKFFAESDRFGAAWLSAEEEKCEADEAEADTAEKACKSASDCVFGSALTVAKKGFSEDVVSITVMFNKINVAATFETTYSESLPNSCDLLFEPGVPEPPYQPEPYPYEPYPYEPYQPESYEPESYQRNPYQRSPNQRNHYQRNHYQHNTYHRNPYQGNHYQRNHYRRNPYRT